MTLQPGQVINNRYRVVKSIGQGGFGAVYRAWDISLNQPCALKENLDNSLQAQNQFQREASVLAGLRHPNLPRVTDYFSIPNIGQYLVMDFVQGDNLDLLRLQYGSDLPEQVAIKWIIQVCDALEYMHSQLSPVIHRDIKPQNILITAQNQAILVDFGICKLYTPGQATTSGARAVTAGYSPPEQYGSARTDPRSDIYSLGATLYFLLTGEEPPISIDRITFGTKLIPPCHLNPAISAKIENAIMKAMEVDMQKRCQSVAEFRSLLIEQNQAALSQKPVYAQQKANNPFPSTIATSNVISGTPQNIRMAETVVAGVQPYAVLTPGSFPSVQYTASGKIPGGIKAAAIYNMVLGIPIGFIGAIAMLKKKNWGRILCLVWLGILTLAGGSFSSYSVKMFLDDNNWIAGVILAPIVFIASFRFFLYLLQTEVKDYFFPQNAPHKSRVNVVLDIYSWFNVLFLFPLVLPLINGIFTLRRKRQWNWALLFFTTFLFWAAGGSFYGYGISDYEPFIAIIGINVFLFFMQIWLFLLRKDVRQAFR
jgi:serine/threonine-protein kinase